MESLYGSFSLEAIPRLFPFCHSSVEIFPINTFPEDGEISTEWNGFLPIGLAFSFISSIAKPSGVPYSPVFNHILDSSFFSSHRQNVGPRLTSSSGSDIFSRFRVDKSPEHGVGTALKICPYGRCLFSSSAMDSIVQGQSSFHSGHRL